MQIIILSIHLLVCVCLIGLVLLQRSEGGALGIGGGGGGGSLMSGRGASDALARLTSIAGGLFLVVSLSLTWLSGTGGTGERSVFDLLPQAPVAAPAPLQPAPAPAEPARTDPTESMAPQAAETELAAAILPGPAPAAAAPIQQQQAPNNAARAAPLDTRQAGVQPRVQQAVAQTPARQTPPPAVQREGAAQTGAGTAPPRLQIPNPPAGAVTGVTLVEPGTPESVELRNGMEAVRRERAGPDQ